MTFNEFRDNVSMMFPQDSGEADKQYQFYIREALFPFKAKPDLSRAWEKVREYDGMKKRPSFAFFKGIADGEKSSDGITAYYKCGCGENLSFSSGGGCPTCKSAANTVMKVTKENINLLQCQDACFDCSIFGTQNTYGPGCSDFGTVGFETCRMRGQCACVKCCQFSYLREHRPQQLRANLDAHIKALPVPISEAGKAFQDGRASVRDIIGFLRSKDD